MRAMNHGLDDKDRKIISLLQKNPYLSQSKIAQHVDLSQPAAYFRIQKLVKKGFLSRSMGVDLKKIGLPLLKIDLSAEEPDVFMQTMLGCPYVLDLYRMDGGHVFSLFLGGENYSTLEAVKSSIADRKGVSELHSHHVTGSKNGLVMPLSMVEPGGSGPCQADCLQCPRYTEKKCLGCPHTVHYRGNLW
ncbi:MAG TPA: Lrp/AsnC family transcriptional regulator [Thermoplasmatales archaeon]|nr:Lrp/AsnC family transcriptional regulator [Thermoplasmatales archaeon]